MTARGGLAVCPMEYAHLGALARGEREQGWTGSEEKLQGRWEDLLAGRAVGLVAEYEGAPAGYIFVYPEGLGGPFGGKGWPEIVDFNVLEKYRRRGVGTALMDAAEKAAARYGDRVYLAVGLHRGYGSAQRMYVKRGYVPDGSGAWYGDAVCPPYGECRNDDDLVLYFSKRIEGQRDRERAPREDAVKIRECGPADAPALALLNKQLIEDEKSQNPMSLPELEERMRGFLSAGYQAFFFEAEDAVVGYALVRTDSSPLYLRQFLIDRKYRRRHYGKEAFRALLGQLGVDTIDIEVLAWNQAGQRFWESCGFREVSRYMRYGG